MGPSGMPTVTLRQLLDSKNSANVKQFYVYDDDGNPLSIFYAQAEAASGEQCLEQVFEYATVSGQALVAKQGWRTSVWSGGEWDI